jgi:hypothetical protein
MSELDQPGGSGSESADIPRHPLSDEGQDAKADEVLARAEAQLWGEVSRPGAGYSPEQLEAGGLAPDDPRLNDSDNSLIRLEHEVKDRQVEPRIEVAYPAFQFTKDSDGQIGVRGGVISEINGEDMLDARGDPWGVADWWLYENAWLGDSITNPATGEIVRRPVDLLDVPGGDETLLQLARAVYLDE